MKLDSLTRIERIVFDQLVLGKSNQEIGDAVVLSECGVKNHVTHIMQKTACSTRCQVIARYYMEILNELVAEPTNSLGGSKAPSTQPDKALLPLPPLP